MAIKQTLNDSIFFTLNRYMFPVVKAVHSCMNISLFNFDRADLGPLTPAMKNRLQLRRSENQAKDPMTFLVEINNCA